MIWVLVLSRNTDVNIIINIITYKSVEALTNSDIDALTDVSVKFSTNTLYKTIIVGLHQSLLG